MAPRNPAEATIAEIWARLIGIEAVSVTDNFFDLGGHSLLAMRAVIEIEKALGVRLNVRRLIFETLGQIAGSIAAPAADAPPDVAAALPPAASGAGKSRGLWGRLIGALRSDPSRTTS